MNLWIAILTLSMLTVMNTEQRAIDLREYGTKLCYEGRFAEGLAAFDSSLVLWDDAETQYRKACMMLMAGQWEAGWRQFETRFRQFPIKGPTQPWWDGEPRGTVGVYQCHGYGDFFQFCRYIVAAREKAQFALIENVQNPPTCDAYTDLFSLPIATRIYNPADSPRAPYIYPSSDMRDKWADNMRSIGGFRVGICWQNNPKRANNRAIPLAEFKRLADVPGVTLVSLQKVDGVEQLQAEPRIIDLGSRLDLDGRPFVDTTAAIANLDLVITCDSAIAHLAGGLGKPTWVALPDMPDWRWALNVATTPWYPNMRLFRQERPGDWSPVFDRIETALRKLT